MQRTSPISKTLARFPDAAYASCPRWCAIMWQSSLMPLALAEESSDTKSDTLPLVAAARIWGVRQSSCESSDLTVKQSFREVLLGGEEDDVHPWMRMAKITTATMRDKNCSNTFTPLLILK